MKISTSMWRTISLFAFILLFTFPGCKKDEDNPTDPNTGGNITGMSGTVTINGDGNNNKTYNFSVAGGTYDVANGNTTVALITATGSDTISIGITFTGKQTGTFNFGLDSNNEPVNGMILVVGTQKIYFSENAGNVKITEYGNIGGYIKGTYQGTLKEMISNSTITVSGSFTAMRGKDE